jgi:hypothetical protein
MSKSGTPHAAEPVPFRNCICSPFVKLRIPTWAVIICDRRNAVESVIWSVPVKNPFSERFHVLFCKQLVVWAFLAHLLIVFALVLQSASESIDFVSFFFHVLQSQL